MTEITLDTIKQFKELFHGLERAYGQWSKNGARTVKGMASDIIWKNHLEGKIGIGIVPIQDGGISEFGVIDIDVNDIDHKLLAKKIEKMEFPLLVCKSKSGGAHCYTFTKPVKTSLVRARLSTYAAKLGFGKAEIFAKQDKLLSPEDIGNWINLPYFHNTRACVDSHGKELTLEEFLAKAKEFKENNDLSVTTDTDQMPPCLQYFLKEGSSEGSRNEVLYNFAIFFKKSNPDSWEEDIAALNYKIFDKPLPNREVQMLVKSLARKDYQYKCKTDPIASFCDSLTCKTLQFGIDASDEVNTYGELLIGGITKIMTAPPRWVVEINGTDLEFTTEDIMDYRRVRILCMEKIDIIAPPMRTEDWLKILKHKIGDKKIIEAPSDANQYGYIEQALLEFITMSDRAKDRTDILRGIPVRTQIIIKTFDEAENIETEEAKTATVFRSHDFMSYMRRKKVTTNLSGPALWMELRKFGCDHTKIRVGHRTIQVWYILPPEPTTEVTPQVERLTTLIGEPEV